MGVGIVLFFVLILALILGIPIAVSIGLSVWVSFLYLGFPATAIVQRMFAGSNSFTLLAIPFFMLAGSVMAGGGMSARLTRLADSAVGMLQGGLAHVQVVASMFFAALSGSSPATCAAVGAILIPEMKKRGYPGGFSAAVQSVASTVGPIIPPSIAFVVYGVVGCQSIGKLFIAGILPGILYGILIMIVIYFIAKKRNYPRAKSFSIKEFWVSFKEAIWALLVPIIILGGIYSGIFTPTEAGAVAAAYGLFAGVFIYKEVNFSNLTKIVLDAAKNTVMVMFIIANASVFSWVLTIGGVTDLVSDFFYKVSGSPGIFLLLTILLLLFMGCFMETVACLLIVTPLLLPVAESFGIDPIHFGVVIVMTLCLGMSTPPVGENLYISASIAGVSFEEVVQNILPFIVAAIIAIVIIAYCPGISLILPNILYN